MAANTTTANGYNQTALAAGQKTEVSLTSGQQLIAGADISGISKTSSGALEIKFANGAVLVVKNYADIAGMEKSPTITLADGKSVALSALIADTPVQGNEQTAAATDVVIAKPKAGEDLVVKLEEGETYTFGFAMNEPTSVQNNEGQLVITFANGGTIIIPNYGALQDNPGAPQITLKDGASIPVTQFGDILTAAAQLNQVEPAAGDSGAGSAGRGFGFQSSFSATDLLSLDPIGPINPTQLQYGLPQIEPVREDLDTPALPPLSAGIEVGDSFVPEDGSTGLSISVAAQNANQQLTVTISGINSAWNVDTSLSGGTYDPATGTWTLVLAPGASFSGGPIVSPPADSDTDMTNLTATVTVTEITTGRTATASDTLSVFTDAVIDAPTLNAANATGTEDTPIPLSITVTPGGDTLDGSEVLSNITISGVLNGTLSAGTDLGGGVWSLTTAQLVGLNFIPNHNYNGVFGLTVSVTDTEANIFDNEADLTNNSATVTDTIEVVVAPTPDDPSVNAENQQVSEDGSVQLPITSNLAPGALATDYLVITISGIAPGWNVTGAGGTFDPIAGTWTVRVPAGQNFSDGPLFSPPADSDADLTGLVVTAEQFDVNDTLLGSSTDTASIVTDAVIDAPDLVVADASGLEDTDIPLTITVSKGGDALDGSEVLSVITISGVVNGTLTAGANLGGGVWQLTSADLVGLAFRPALNYSGKLDLVASVTDTETNLSGGEFNLNNNTATDTEVIHVTVTPVADTPTLNVFDKQVKEDGSVALRVDASLNDTDGSEQLTVSIAGLSGWGVDTTASGGTYNSATGVWTLTLPVGVTSFSGGPRVSPPANSDADLNNLLVTATATELDGGDTATNTATMNVVTDAVIDAPSINAPDVTGNEDSPIALNINVSRGGDTLDGSEVLSNVTISGVVNGTLSAGTNLGGGVWSLTTAQLAGLNFVPNRNFNGTVNLTVSVTDTETNLSGAEFDTTDNTATATDTIRITVTPVGDDPSVSAPDVQVKEDGFVQLVVSATLSPGSQPTEFMTVTISGILPGWNVDTAASGGIFDAIARTWTITVAPGENFTGGPVFSPPANSDVDMSTLVVTARQFDASNTLLGSATDNAAILVDAVIDAPSITAPDVTGNEDTSIPLTINVSRGGDTLDGSEVLSNITVSGVTNGALSAGINQGGGVWVLTPAQLTGLNFIPNHNFNGTVNLTVSVTDTETVLSGVEFDTTDNSATRTDTIKITVNPVNDDPSVNAPDVQVKEDGSVQLVVTAALAAGSVTSDFLTITITGIQAGWGVNTTLSGGTYNAATGTYTLTVPAGQNFSGGPIFSPPANSDVDMTGLVVTARQFDASNTLLGSSTDGAAIIVDAVIDGPSITAPDVTGNEDTAIPLIINVSRGGDTLDGSEVLSNITISGVTNGALSAGTNLGGGVWSLTLAQLTGLNFIPNRNFNGTVNLTVSVTDTETNTSGVEFDTTDNTATATDAIKITVNPASDDPSVNAPDVQVKEDGSVQLIVAATLAAGSVASDFLTITITGIQAGWGVNTTLSGGTYNAATGTWTITVPAGQNFSGGPVFSPPANSDVDMTTLVVTARQFDASSTLLGSSTDNASIVVDAVIDAPSIVAPDVTGNEDASIPLIINVSRGGDTLDGSEVLSNVTISGVTNGILSAGVNLGGGNWSLTLAQLTGLNFIPNRNFNGTVNLTVSVTDTETNLSGAEFDTTDNTATATDTIKITVNPVNDDPSVNAPDVQVKEDGSVQLVVTAALAAGSVVSDFLTITITGIQAGWGVNTTLSGGTYNAATGTYTLTVPAGQNFNGGPIFTPPANSDVDMSTLVVTARQFDASNTLLGSSSDNASIIVDAVIDAPTISAADVTGNEDTAIPLIINVSRGGDTADGSEVLSNITISGVTNGILSAGTNLGGGNWSLTAAQLTGLNFIPNANYSGHVNLTVKVTDTETNLSGAEFDTTDNTATATDTLEIYVCAVPDKPTVSAMDKVVKEDGSVALQVSASLADTDGSERLQVSISGIAPGWTVNASLSGGTYSAATGTWTLVLPAGVTSFSGGPTISPPANSDRDLSGLIVTATATETDGGATNTATATLNVITDAVIDGPSISADDVTGGAGTEIPLVINVGRGGDTADGSEVLGNVMISGVPSGALLNQGTNLGGGNWSLTQAQLTGLTIKPAAGASGDFTLTVKVTETETNLLGAEPDLTDNSATATDTLKLTVEAPVFIVGKNVDDKTGSTTTYQVGGGTGVITGKSAPDVLVGDIGGASTVNQNKDYNIVLVLDVSGSMAGNKLALLKSSVANLLDSFNDYTGGSVKVHIIPFSTASFAGQTFTVTGGGTGLTAAKSFVNGFVADGFTNFEDPLQDAISWLQSSGANAPTTGADTFTYFVSDGEPNRYINNSGAVAEGDANRVIQEITGAVDVSGTANDDRTNEVAILQGLSNRGVIGVGIEVSATTIARLDIIDSTPGGALDVQDANDLSAALQGASPLNQLADVGSDVITGNAGDDFIFGDSLFTDVLATTHGINVAKGAGWDVFARLEAGQSTTQPGWTRTDTIAYIKTHAAELGQESTGSGGQHRQGGNDTLSGGAGNDTIFGQEGNDVITGGLGNDVLWGGTGQDDFIVNSVSDGVDTIKDFRVAEGDVLDLSNVLTGFDPLTESLANFVRVTNSGGNSTVQVDVTGSGAAYQTVALLEGITIDIDTLVNSGNLIA